jgi:NADPH:quinone reductase-like Zn-dependent oxidoreductase
MATMIRPLQRAVQIAPEQVAVRCGAVALNYGEVWDRAGRSAPGAYSLMKRSSVLDLCLWL